MKPATVILAAALASIPGCVTPENDRVTEGHGPAAVRSEAFTRDSGKSAAGQGAGAPLGTLGPELRERSVTGLSRDNWGPTVVTVPVDGTAHRPTYTRRVIGTDSSARQRRQYPTPETALELTQGSGEDQALEAAASHAIAVTDLVLLPLRAAWQPPWAVRWSPDESAPRVWTAPNNAAAVTPVPNP